MADFDGFIAGLKAEIATLAASQFKAFTGQAIADGEAFVKAMQADLQRWTKELSAGQIDEEDFKDLVAGEKVLAELLALKQAGLAKAALDKFANGLVDLVVNCAVKAFV